MMRDDKTDVPASTEPKQDAAEAEMSEADLGKVAGGLNPQPLPPGFHSDTSSLGHIEDASFHLGP
jgi:hypothetical protein